MAGMPTPSYHRLQQSLTQFAGALAVLVAVSLPLGYGSAVYRDFNDDLEFKGKMKVIAVEALIVSRPETWMLTEKRVRDALERRPELERFERLQVFDLERMLVAEAGEAPLTPVVQRSFELHDADRVTGFLEYEVSLRSTLVKIGISVLIGVGLGFLVFLTLRVLPLRVLRRVMDAFRSINEMVFAMLFVVAVGLGPFAGVLALWISTTGVLAKLFAEAVEAIDPGPVEGVRATGASALQEVIYGVIPQVMPLWVSYALYRFEANVRSATVVGMVGAGGIGVILWENIRAFQFVQTCAVLLVIIVVVSLIDVLSQRLRKRFI